VDTYLIDYSASKLAGAVIKATAVGPAGEHPVGAVRYIDAPNLLGTKHTSLVEYQDHVRTGLTDYMFFEVNENDALGGYAQGQAYARRAKAGADYLGYTGVILFCCDRWLAGDPAKGIPTIPVLVWQAYLDGAVSVLGRGRVGAYGFFDAMDAAVGHVDFFVQCGARSVVRDFVHIWQDNTFQPYVGGIQTDRLLVLKPINQGVPDMFDQPDRDALTQVLNQLMGPWPSKVPGAPPEASFSLVDWARVIDKNVFELMPQVAAQGAQISGLVAAIAAATTNTAITPEFVQKTIDAAVAAHVIPVTGTIQIGSAPAAPAAPAPAAPPA
jgi:hypothetical protein